MPPETVFCRCEEVTKGELDAALALEGPATSARSSGRRASAWGAARGAIAGPALAQLVAERRGEAVSERSFFAPRAPVKPVRIATVVAAQAAIDALGARTENAGVAPALLPLPRRRHGDRAI